MICVCFIEKSVKCRIRLKIAKNNKKYAIFDFSLYGRWEDLDRWKWVVIDVGVILDAFASHSENFFSDIFLSHVWYSKNHNNRHPLARGGVDNYGLIYKIIQKHYGK